ncbi:hypothetical protein EMM73_10640 [Rheinheimera sediminis]|uniref:DUF4144 family protein n=1 Tax=Rheinheimera sp. YQF-1 TaxID=2499626 RepID=UPI000FDC4019|nr:DUF4144 family protein [Rheinheimera sp. YQF-1]RVT46151.1 hypothetical protein EMM73_10640 [Rheinheimera sp. YQF-1]
MMISYPAIFKFTGQDELIYLAGPSCFRQFHALQQLYLTPEDLLIDAKGQAYLLHQMNQDSSALPLVFKQFELSELTAMVQSHFFALAQSCIVKIQAESIEALFSLLAETGNN